MREREVIETHAKLNSRQKEDAFLEVQLDIRDLLCDIRDILKPPEPTPEVKEEEKPKVKKVTKKRKKRKTKKTKRSV